MEVNEGRKCEEWKKQRYPITAKADRADASGHTQLCSIPPEPLPPPDHILLPLRIKLLAITPKASQHGLPHARPQTGAVLRNLSPDLRELGKINDRLPALLQN